MEWQEGLTALFIHIVVPLLGVACYIKLLQRMQREEITEPPKYELFIIFATYGGLLIVILTVSFWMWSGMATLGFFYLLIGAPIVMGIIASKLNLTKEISRYHFWAYKSAVWYFAIGPAVLLSIFLVARHIEGG